MVKPNLPHAVHYSLAGGSSLENPLGARPRSPNWQIAPVTVLHSTAVGAAPAGCPRDPFFLVPRPAQTHTPRTPRPPDSPQGGLTPKRRACFLGRSHHLFTQFLIRGHSYARLVARVVPWLPQLSAKTTILDCRRRCSVRQRSRSNKSTRTGGQPLRGARGAETDCSTSGAWTAPPPPSRILR